jgi:hypothetical protein
MGMFYCDEQIVKMSILNRLFILTIPMTEYSDNQKKRRNTSRMRKKEKSLGL